MAFPSRWGKFCGVHVGSDYSPEQEEFIKAVDSWKARTVIMFPALTDLLHILKELGYRKVTDGEPEMGSKVLGTGEVRGGLE